MLISVCNLYVEHISKEDLIEKLNNLVDCKYINYYVGILHDKDLKEDKSLKKAHFHLICDFNDNCLQCRDNKKKSIITQILQEKLDINCFYECCRNEKLATQYLIHLNDKDKYRYNKVDIFTNNKDRLDNCLICKKARNELNRDLLNNLLLVIDRKVYDNTLSENNYITFTQEYFIENLDYYLNHYQSLNNFVKNNIFRVSENKSIEESDYYNCIDLLNSIEDF